MGLENLTNHARKSLLRASKIARKLQASTVNTAHLLLAIAQESGSIGQNLLQNMGVDAKTLVKLSNQVKKQNADKLGTDKLGTSKLTSSTQIPTLSESLKNVIVQAYQIAGKNGYPYVGTEHIAYALLSSSATELKSILTDAQVKKQIIGSIANTPASDSPIPNLTKLFDFPGNPRNDSDGENLEALEHFCTPILPENSKTIIGRDEEVDRMITILGRKEKSNPLLVGEPGVGKTALVEALAQRIDAGSVPAPLMEAEIVILDVAAIVAGTTFRGEFEARIKDIIVEAEENPQIILFIDELHTIMGAGGGQGTLDAANILKPALARGKLRIIGATTHVEYKKYIAKDAALARRFGTIIVREPSRDECITMLAGVSNHYAQFHNVHIERDLLEDIVDLSIRFLPDRFLPDKALDILDETSAQIKMKQTHDPKLKELVNLRSAIKTVGSNKLEAVNDEDYNSALLLRTEEQQLHEKLRKLEESIYSNQSAITLTKEDIFQSVATLGKIPVTQIAQNTDENIIYALDAWRTVVIGQNEATDKIAKTIMRSYSGLSPETRPTGSFLFLGPSGIGKTLAATTLANNLFGDDALIRIDMSELMEKHSIAKLIGAPAGYVGHEEGGSLTEKIRINPYSVVLFDEIEKAHPDTLNILLQILEDGTLTDAAGNRADFRHAVIILTSNIGTRELTTAAELGFDNQSTNDTDKSAQFNKTKDRILTTLRQHIAPELLNRIDDIVVFNALGRPELTEIARIQLGQLSDQLKKQNVKLRISPAIAPTIGAKTNSIEHGARGIRRHIRQHLEDQIAQILLQTPTRPLTISVTASKDKVHEREIFVKI